MSKTTKKPSKFVKKVLDNIAVVGECQCGGHLIVSLKSNKTNKFDVYCTDCGSISDIRFPKSGDSYFITKDQHPVDLLCAAYAAHDLPQITDDMINTISDRKS